MSRVDGPWRRAPGTQAVCAALTGAGHVALFVGGCVRNALLGAAVDDIDIATDAHPEAVMALAAAAGLKAVPTGLAHGTVTVVADHRAHEVTTFRRDVETFGRHAVVAFSADPAEDAARRDFTFNALYATPAGAVLDPLGTGLNDLAARRVRFIGAPQDRIREDYLRILRFFRFHAWYGQGGLDAEGLAACAGLAEGVQTLSRERLGAEMKKLLAAPDPAPAVAAMAQAGVLGRVLPGASVRALAPLVHIEGLWGLAPDALRRLAALGGADVAERLRLSRAEAARRDRLAEAAQGQAGAGELGYRLGADEGAEALALRAALLEALPAPGARTALAAGAQARFPITAADLMPGLSGAALGAALKEREARWIASGFTLTRAELLG